MRVFISWSGELSRPLAEVLRDWLPSALQFVKPYFSPNDIEKGSRWEGILAGELSASSVGIFVMTHENRDSRWLHFEAGVIAKSIDRSRVCPMLFGIEPTDLEGPLAHFQSTRFAKDDVKRLFLTINAAGDQHKLADATAAKVFEKWWPELDKQLKDVLARYKPATAHVRSERELIEEILMTVRRLSNAQKSRLVGTYWEGPDFCDDLDASDPAKPWVPLEITLKSSNAREMQAGRKGLMRTLNALGDKIRIVPENEDREVVRALVRNGNVDFVRDALKKEHKDSLMSIIAC